MESIARDLGKWRFWRKYLASVFGVLGIEAVVAGVFDNFFPGTLADALWIVWPGLAVAAVIGLGIAWPRPIQASYNAPKTSIRLIEGDLFDSRDHLVVGFSNTFDTAQPHIAMASVQGQFLEREYESDVDRLDRDLGAALAGKPTRGKVAGKSGKQVRYPIGTVATLRADERRFFLVAYSEMDARSSAHATPDGIWTSLSALWEEVRAESNGSTVRIPVVGGGQSKISDRLPAQDSLRFIALSFMLASRKEKVCNELVIVALPGEYGRLDHLEFQAFLKALRPS